MTDTTAQAPLVWAAPDWQALDTLAQRTDPPILWPIGHQPLVFHWLDHAVRLGRKHVILYCPDRPAAVRAALEGGDYWSLQIDLRPTPPPSDLTVEHIDHLPDQPYPNTGDGAALVRWWLDLNLQWVSTRDASRVHVDLARETNGWIGPRVLLGNGVELRPPYWIGAGTRIDSGCTIGPGALIGPGSVISADVRIQHALVQAGTFVGTHLELDGKLLLGSTLLDPAKNARYDLTDDFIAAAMSRPAHTIPLYERFLALALWLPAQVLALGAQPTTKQHMLYPSKQGIQLTTGTRGCLLARRARWLSAVIRGDLRLIGILPRTHLPDPLPAETRALLTHTTPGVFSLADLHHTHDTDQPDELAHALYQAALPDSDSQVLRALLKLCLTRPPAA